MSFCCVTLSLTHSAAASSSSCYSSASSSNFHPPLLHPSLSSSSAWPPPVLPRTRHSLPLQKECVCGLQPPPPTPTLPSVVICGEPWTDPGHRRAAQGEMWLRHCCDVAVGMGTGAALRERRKCQCRKSLSTHTRTFTDTHLTVLTPQHSYTLH